MRNVVMVTYDSLRADHCGYIGYDRDTTPTLDAMAEDGIAFENAIAPASRTNPSMAGTLTGEPLVVRDRVAAPEYARRHLERYETIAARLSERGYATGAFCPNAYASSFYGFDAGFDHFEDFLFGSDAYQSLFEKHLSDSSLFTAIRNARNYVRRQEAFKTWDTYVEDVQAWVDEQEEPFFLWIFSLDTHFPYLTPRRHRQWGSLWQMYYYNWRCNQLIDQFDIDLSPTERRRITDIYDDSIYFGDRLLDELQERLNEYDPTYIVYGDHGEALGERGIYGHFYPSLYEENVHVPLVVSGGDVSATVSDPISLLSMPELVTQASEDRMTSVADAGRDWVLATDYDGRDDRNLTALRTRSLKYVHTASGEEGNGPHHELFDLTADGGERRDLIGTGHPAEDALRKLVERRCHHERETLEIGTAASEVATEEEAVTSTS